MPGPVPNIWLLQSQGDVEGLSAALRHSDSGARRGAAAALRALGAWQTVPALEAALALEHDWQAHAAISAALQYLDHDLHIETMIRKLDVRGLSKMLASSRTEDVITACHALAGLGDRQAVEPLVMVFRSPLAPDPVKLAAAEALLKLESAPAIVTLLGALRRENWQVRRNAAAVLGQLQATWATQPLIETLGDEHPAVRRTVVAALRRMATEPALRAARAYEEAEQRQVQSARKTQPHPAVTLTQGAPQAGNPKTPLPSPAPRASQGSDNQPI